MAHPATEASAPPTNSGEAVEDFADFLDTIPDEEQDEDETAPQEGDEPDALTSDDLEEALEGDEPEAPAIDPPVSWGTDAKELFAQLPPELQTQVAEREAQREKLIQAKTTEAAEAKRSARTEAEAAFGERQRQYANEIEFFASRMMPQAPDPALANHDPVAFIRQNAQYQAGLTQYQQMMQRADVATREAQQRDHEAAQESLRAEEVWLAQQLPEWNDPAKRQALLTDIGSVGAELGYDVDSLNQANAMDILALKKATEWKADAERYRALQKGKMEKVRAAKTLPRAVRPGVAPTRGEIDTTRSQNAWKNVTGARSKEAQSDAFATYLETAGLL